LGVESAHTKKGDEAMDGNMIRIVCSAVAVALLGLIVVRRKQKADD
jgi:hypothetical protein